MTVTPTLENPTAIQSSSHAKEARIKRKAPQLLADEIIAPSPSSAPEELIAGPPTKNGRVLSSELDPWSHNAWDQIEYTEEMDEHAREIVEKQASNPVPPELVEEFNADPAGYWDKFYANVKDKFFNDRAWLQNEFPELIEASRKNSGPKRIVEIGCGPGNTLFPLFALNENPELSLVALDYSQEAISLVKSNPALDPNHIKADVWDLSSAAGLPDCIEPGSVDIAVMVFVFSALHPNEWERAVQNLFTMLKPGGILLFRDYGRNDMAQLRFKKNRYLQPGLYVRGDGTRVYFFERDELVQILGNLESENKASSATKRLNLLQLGVDRRLLLNRKRQLKMYRVWMQGRWQKPIPPSE